MAVRFDVAGTPAGESVDAAVREVLRVHPMLRARLDDVDGAAEFVVTDKSPVVFFFDTTSAEAETACTRVFNQLSERVGIDNGTPVGFGVVRVLDSDTTSIVVVAHHFVMDVVSLQIAVGDLIEALGSGDRDFRLPAERTSAHEWVHWLTAEASASGMWEQCRAAYRGTSPGPVRDAGTEGAAVTVTRSIPATAVGAAMTALGAGADEVLQGACAAAYSTSTGANPTVLEVETHGRELASDAIDLTRAVGWFTGLSSVPVHTATMEGRIAEIRGRRGLLGDAGQLTETLRHLVGDDPAPGVLPHVGVNYVGTLDSHRVGSLRGYGSGRLRAACTPRPVEVQVDAWFSGDEFVLSVEHVDGDAAQRVADAVVAELHAAQTSGPVGVTNGVCRTDLRGNTIEDVMARVGGIAEAVAPLTTVQEAMFLRSDSDDAGAYLEQIVLSLPVGIDVERLSAATASVMRVMPLLRGVVVWEGLADPVLAVGVRGPDVHVVDDVDPTAEITALAGGPELFRATITPERLVMTFHHLVADGWTVRALLQHVDDHYAGRPTAADRPSNARSYGRLCRLRARVEAGSRTGAIAADAA